MGLFTELKRFKVYSALYCYGEEMDNFYPIYDFSAENEEALDSFAFDVMKEQGLPEPYFRISCHITKYEKRRVRR